MGEIVPTILTASLTEYGEKLRALEGIANRVQVDVIDGKFINNQTVSLEALKNEPTSLRMDLHLMVKEPEDWVKRALEILPDRLIAQVEMMNDFQQFINEAIEGGIEVGLAFDLETPITAVPEEILSLVDVVLLLSVKAGFGGQEFDQRVLEKISAVKKIVGNLVKIGVDGGLNEKNIVLCHKAGADIFYIGQSFWQVENSADKLEDLAKRYQQLNTLIN